MQFIPVYLIFIPVLTSLFIYLYQRKHMNYLALIAQLALTILLVVYHNHYQGHYADTLFVFGNWSERIGISLSNDEISISFLFLTVFSWWIILIYLFDSKKTNHNLLFFLMFLEGVFIGLLMTNDLFNMFVFLELMTIIVTILIAFKKTGNSFRAAINYILVNTVGVLMFLIGIILIYNTFGTINIIIITEMMEGMGDEFVIRFAYALMMSGIAVKSALFPVFTWLPRAHGASQSAISALLSGLIVKGGLYLFIRINGMFDPAGFDYTNFFYVIGALTAIFGVMFALSQKDIKQVLAYHTVSQIGIIMMGLSSLHDTDIFYGGLLHIFNHALFKSLLFLGAGVIIKVYHTKKVTEIRGVFKAMPLVSIFMIIGMLSITGAPFFNGFISKSIIKYGVMDSDIKYWILFVVNIGTATSFIKMSQIFFGKRTMTVRLRKIPQRASLMILAFSCVMLGNFYIPLTGSYFGLPIKEISVASWQSFFDYFLAIGIGYVFYRYAIKPDWPIVRGIRDFKMSFETSNVIFITFLVVMSLYFIAL